ncbi:MAG TPA: 23S rRNA (pseudouridine(1915)-N(3))-methyltransferase RlmH [Chthoniobacteraceae bacterium]|jgi:23S rRNA (pseudouridine1915-N3)-methyltransferase|nr:23S rRNA (pseudouridine(1915)-N(3))-methyltransferase RlmH [Chthoniobacteraceae bacterium]
MRWHIFAIGKPKLAYAKAGIEEYAARLGSCTQVEFTSLKAGSREQESAALLERSEGQFRIVLDERGEQMTSKAFSEKISAWEQSRVKSIAVLIGGADGHTEALRAAAGWSWSLSRLTLQHELALVVALEQIYRAYSIKAGAPYHREG